LSIGYISGEALMHSCTHAKGRINKNNLLTPEYWLLTPEYWLLTPEYWLLTPEY
jgi:hypothetical protein